jgi:predicted Fe-Mo cluster-binding NifX family protein
LKIVLVTNDGKSISQHFGRAIYYVFYDMKKGAVKGSEIRSKAACHAGCDLMMEASSADKLDNHMGRFH